MVRIIALISLFLFSFNAHAQLFKHVAKIETLSDIPKSILPGSAPLELKFKLLGKDGRIVRNKRVSVEASGNSSVSASSVVSDSQGIINIIFTPSSRPEISKLRIEYAPATSRIGDLLDLKDNSHYSEIIFQIQDLNIDFDKSSAKFKGPYQIKQTDKAVEVIVEIKNAYEQRLSIDEFSVTLSDLKLLEKKSSEHGIFNLSFERPKEVGKHNLSLVFNGKEISKEEVEVIPILDSKSLKLEITNNGQNRFDAHALVLDVDGNPYTSKETPSFSVTETKVKIEYSNTDSYHYQLFVPEGKGSAEAVFTIEGQTIKEKFTWDYFPYNVSDVEVSIYPNRIAATGYDNARIEISIPKLSSESAKSILQNEGFEAYIVEGEGQLAKLELKTDKSGKPVLEAIFTSPFVPGKTYFGVKNKKGLIDDNLVVEYDNLILACGSQTITDYSTLPSYIYDDINLIKKIIDGLNVTQGFNLSNRGPNKIVPKYWERGFDFSFPDQAKQLMKLVVQHHSTHPDSRVSHTHMLSSFYFFPRKEIPRMEEVDGNRIKVTLPTGEEVFFDKETKEIVGGVLEEGPVDGRDDRFTRTFPDIRYKGEGYVIRANARGQMPEEGNFSKTKISGEFGHAGEDGVLIYRYNQGTGKTEKCQVTKASLFKKVYNGNSHVGSAFKFATDEEFYAFINKSCKFK